MNNIKFTENKFDDLKYWSINSDKKQNQPYYIALINELYYITNLVGLDEFLYKKYKILSYINDFGSFKSLPEAQDKVKQLLKDDLIFVQSIFTVHS